MNIATFAKWILGIDLLAVGIALFLGYLGNSPSRFFGEHQYITWMSGLQLLTIGVFAWQIWRKRGGQFIAGFWREPLFLWLLIALGFIFLTADELAQIHEHLDKWIHRGLHMKQTGWTDRLDDVLVGLYGVIGLAVLYHYRKEFKHFRPAIPFFIAGFLCLFVMVGMDIISNRPDVFKLFTDESTAKILQKWTAAGEDSFKLLGEGVFLCAFYAIRARSINWADPATLDESTRST